MGTILKLLTGTSQGATPVQDGGVRAALVALLNGGLLVLCHAAGVSDSDTLIVVAAANPLSVLIFAAWDKFDSALMAEKGVTTAPTVTKRSTEVVEP